jgi:hypothetical protein
LFFLEGGGIQNNWSKWVGGKLIGFQLVFHRGRQRGRSKNKGARVSRGGKRRERREKRERRDREERRERKERERREKR